MSSSSKLFVLRRILTTTLKSPASSSSTSRSLLCPLYLLEASNYSKSRTSISSLSRSFCSCPSNRIVDVSQGPVAVDYSSLLQEDEFHRLADSTIQDLLEKIEEYEDSVDIDGFDIDYGNQVLTVKLGNLGIYVLNKQTPNRQIWMSSPVSGPSRFDWDQNAHAWIYKRNKEHLLKTLESELEQLCGKPVSLS